MGRHDICEYIFHSKLIQGADHMNPVFIVVPFLSTLGNPIGKVNALSQHNHNPTLSQ